MAKAANLDVESLKVNGNLFRYIFSELAPSYCQLLDNSHQYETLRVEITLRIVREARLASTMQWEFMLTG